MTSNIFLLSLAVTLFIIAHLAMSSSPFRSKIILRYGKYVFLGIYSLVSSGLLTWSIYEFLGAPNIPVFTPTIILKQISLVLMIFSTFFVVAGYTTPNPGIIGMESFGINSGARGVLKITRHPVMCGVFLWGISHILANGHQAAIIFFGGISILALTGAIHIDRKRNVEYGNEWTRYKEKTSFVPMVAIIVGRAHIESSEIPWWQTTLSIFLYVLALWGHYKIGRPVIPSSVL